MAKATLTWNANTEPDLAGYKIYRAVGTAPQTLLVTVGKVTNYIDDPLPQVDGNIGYALTAFDTAGNESVKSLTVTKTVNSIPPVAPTGLDVVIG